MELKTKINVEEKHICPHEKLWNLIRFNVHKCWVRGRITHHAMLCLLKICIYEYYSPIFETCLDNSKHNNTRIAFTIAELFISRFCGRLFPFFFCCCCTRLHFVCWTKKKQQRKTNKNIGFYYCRHNDQSTVVIFIRVIGVRMNVWSSHLVKL